MRAGNAIGPALALEELPSSFLIGKLLKELIEADGLGLVHGYLPSIGR
jgi:hypothetical protein